MKGTCDDRSMNRTVAVFGWEQIKGTINFRSMNGTVAMSKIIPARIINLLENR